MMINETAKMMTDKLSIIKRKSDKIKLVNTSTNHNAKIEFSMYEPNKTEGKG